MAGAGKSAPASGNVKPGDAPLAADLAARCRSLATRADDATFYLPLGVGGHVRRDVPEIVEAISREHPGVAFRIASALGEEASVQDAMARASVAAAKA